METNAPSVAGKVAVVGDEGPEPERTTQQLERLQESAVAALSAMSSHLDLDQDLPGFFARLGATVAAQTGARRAAFWRLGPRGALSLQPKAHGFPDSSPIYTARLHTGARGERVVERLVFHDDLELANGTAPQLDAVWQKAGLADVNSSIAAAWQAGGRRIGAVAVYDSERGFTSQDLWLLRLVGMAAGMLWQLKESEDELTHTEVRLKDAIAARRVLLNNIATGGDEARQRFATALHDDSLQLFTAAELQVERLRSEPDGGRQTVQLDQLRHTLRRVEHSLRRLLVSVSSEPLQLPGDLREAISERLESMRIHSGIEPHIEGGLPDVLPEPIRAIVRKNIDEALTNVDKHASATKVTVVTELSGGGVRVRVEDDGTGFAVAESMRVPGHIGLVALRERAQLAGGWCRIHSGPGAGTSVEFWVPMS